MDRWPHSCPLLYVLGQRPHLLASVRNRTLALGAQEFQDFVRAPGHILCVCISVPFTVTSYIQFSSHHIALAVAVIIYSDLNHAQPKPYGGRPRAGPRSTLLGGLLLWGTSGRGPNFKACSHMETQQLQAAKTSAVEYLSFGSNS